MDKRPIPELKAYLNQLADVPAREEFAKRCGTTLGYMRLVANGFKSASAELAINVDRESAGNVKAERVAPDVDFSHIRGTPPAQGQAAA